ncbi:hypothetical protein [Fulvivirga ligni]|uniref:hypothetical protein n=1 Tax=Fulvivirga ligni TaxID=2904246 RepID=UPI001F3C18BE|nr:hypothetical protein [Fulvivirga ligni]UII19279.1 hypothetical protein LVD16_15650 [Fulvivirga ligni]
MELDELLKRKLINKKIHHPVYGEVGLIADILKNNIKYIVFKERSLQNLTSDSNILRAVPVNYLYIDHHTSDLMVNFNSDWIKDAPKFTHADLLDKREPLIVALDEYYRENRSIAV